MSRYDFTAEKDTFYLMSIIIGSLFVGYSLWKDQIQLGMIVAAIVVCGIWKWLDD
jgi:hypothetical protein